MGHLRPCLEASQRASGVLRIEGVLLHPHPAPLVAPDRTRVWDRLPHAAIALRKDSQRGRPSGAGGPLRGFRVRTLGKWCSSAEARHGLEFALIRHFPNAVSRLRVKHTFWPRNRRAGAKLVLDFSERKRVSKNRPFCTILGQRGLAALPRAILYMFEIANHRSRPIPPANPNRAIRPAHSRRP